MAFTQDEIQALNTIFEQKLAQHRLEVERSFEKRLQRLHLEFEQQLAQSHQEILHVFTQGQAQRQERLRETIMQGVEAVQPHVAQRLGHEMMARQQHQQQQIETLIERTLAAHLLAVEQLLQQQQTNPPQKTGPLPQNQYEGSPDFEAIEVQTELPWEDFVDVIGKILDERLSVLDDSLRAAIANMERYFSGRLHEIRDDMLQEHGYENKFGNMNVSTNLQEVFTGMQQLEHLVESMQVAMTANHAMLSNRLYHHQHLPLERAHRSSLGQTSTEHDATGRIFLQEHE